MSAVEGVPERFAGVNREEWAAALDAAAAVGLLTSIGAGMYRIHPALPAYLAALWRRETGDDHDSEHARASSALLSAYAAFGDWLLKQMQTGDAGFALRIVELQRRTIGHLLGAALEREDWEAAQSIAQPLNEYLDSRGLDEEARGWVDRVRLATESPDGAAPDLRTPAGALWMFVVGSQANREQRQGRLERSERTYLEIRDALAAQEPSPTQQRHLAAAYHQLGIVAQARGRLDDAEDWYRQSLTIKEELGNRPGMASTYHQLGIVAQARGRLDDAEDWYRQSLTINEELGNRPGMASTYHQLGIVAQARGRLDDAEDWYRQSLTINEELGNRPGMASTYHQLGIVAQHRGRLRRRRRLVPPITHDQRGARQPPRHGQHLPPARDRRAGPRAPRRRRRLVPPIAHDQRGARQPPRHGHDLRDSSGCSPRRATIPRARSSGRCGASRCSTSSRIRRPGRGRITSRG